MKLTRKHIHALDIGIHKVLGARDRTCNVDEKDMLTENANRLRQLRMFLWVAFTEPKFDFNVMFKLGIAESDPLAKGIRMLTNDPISPEAASREESDSLQKLDKEVSDEKKTRA